MFWTPSLTQTLLLSSAFSFLSVTFAPEWSWRGSLFSTWLASFAVLVGVTQLLSVIIWPKLLSPLRHLPSPKGGSFFNGHARYIINQPAGRPMLKWLHEIPNEGLIKYNFFFNTERVLLTSPNAIRDVLVTKSYDFVKPLEARYALGRLLGVGVLLAEGDEHKTQRKNLMPAFQFRHIKNLYPTFWGKSAEMVQAVTSLIEEEERKTGSKGTTIEFAGWLSRCTLDIIGIAGLGYKFKALEQPDNEVNQAYRRVFTPSKQAKMLAVAGMVFPPITPLLRLLPVQRNEDIAASASTIRAVSRKIIEEKQRRLSEKGTSDIDILSVALGSGGFSIENLVDQTMTFLAAGHETTATSTTWAVYALCNNPKMQERLRAEIRSALPSPNENVQMTPELIDHLPYLNAFCNEVLRFYAPVPFTRRVAAKDTSISGQFIPKDTHVILVPSAINVSKELWGEDADVFNPERWMAPKQANSGGAVSNYANLTFLHGPRSCIGLSFAKAEFACLLATIAGRFKMDLAPELKGKDLEMEVSIVRKPKNGLKVQMEVVEGW